MAKLDYGLPTITPFAKTVLDDADAATVRRTIGVAEDPLDIIPEADRLFWHEADAKTIETGVDSLIDLFYEGNDLAQATDASQPAFGATSGPRSRPVLTFDGSDDVIGTAAATVGAQAFTVWLLAKVTTWANDDYLISLLNSAQTAGFQIRTLTGADRWGLFHAGVEVYSTEGVNDGAYHLLRMEMDYTGDLLTLGVDDVTATEADTGAAVTVGRIVLGAATAAGGSPTAMQWLCAVGMVGASTLAQRLAMTRYVNRKWGLNIAEPS